MSEPKLIIKEESSAKKTRSPPKKPKVEQSVPRKKKLKTDADRLRKGRSTCVLAKLRSPRMKHPA